MLLPTVWLVVLLAAPGLLILTAVVVAFLLHRPAPPAGGGGPDARGPDASRPGWYVVRGFDGRTHFPREMTLNADSPAAARGRAEMEGVVVTEVKPADLADQG